MMPPQNPGAHVDSPILQCQKMEALADFGIFYYWSHLSCISRRLMYAIRNVNHSKAPQVMPELLFHLLQVLIQLLLLTCDPSMAAAASMQQCLAVFFRAYAAQSGQAHRHLSAAALPAARRALSIGPSLAKSAAPQLLKFVSTLLQVGCRPQPWRLGTTQ